MFWGFFVLFFRGVVEGCSRGIVASRGSKEDFGENKRNLTGGKRTHFDPNFLFKLPLISLTTIIHGLHLCPRHYTFCS